MTHTPSHRHLSLISRNNHSSPILSHHPISSSPIISRTTRSSVTASSSLPVTPHHPHLHPYSYHYSNANLLDRILSSPSHKNSSSFLSHQTQPDNNSLYSTLIQTGIQLTPDKLSKAINHLISEKKSTILNSDMHAVQQRSFPSKRPIDHLEQTPRKKIKIQSAPDGSASLVISSDPNQVSNSSLTPSTTITSSSPSVSSETCLNQPRTRPHPFPFDHQSTLVSADIQDYGRVAIKKEALIDRLGFEAAQRAIRKARASRKCQQLHPPRPAPLPPSPQTASSRTSRIKKWLDSADHDEDEENHSIIPSDPALNTKARGLLDAFTRLTEFGRNQANKPVDPPATDPQSLFWSPVQPSTSQAVLTKSNNTATRESSCDFNSLRMVTDSSRIPTLVNRPSTPPHRRSFFSCDLDNKSNSFGSFSHRLFSQSPPTSSMNTMLKPGCNLNQSFLSLAPSPTIILTGSDELSGGVIQNDENRLHALKNDPATRSHRSGFTSARNLSRQSSNSFRSSKNDFSPCSPVRQEVLKLLDQRSRLESPSNNNNNNRSYDNILDSYSSFNQSLEHSWLTELDPNRDRSNPNVQPQPSRHQLSNYNHFNSLSSLNFFDDQNIYEDFLAFS